MKKYLLEKFLNNYGHLNRVDNTLAKDGYFCSGHTRTSINNTCKDIKELILTYYPDADLEKKVISKKCCK